MIFIKIDFVINIIELFQQVINKALYQKLTMKKSFEIDLQIFLIFD